MSREERARCILKLCETVARNAVPDLDDVDDEDMENMKTAYTHFVSKTRYLMRQSEAAWTPAFGKVLSSACCMSVARVERDDKERKRGYSGRCMACGREESQCRYAVNLAGNLDPDAWLQGPEAMLRSYNVFVEEYDGVFDKNFHSKAVKAGSLPSIDKGCYIVGETCLRKAKIRFILQTLLLETTYEAEREVEELVRSGEKLDASVIYTATEETVNDFINLVDKLELAIADSKRALPPVRVDESYWQILDDVGRELAGHDDQKADNLAFERANMLLDQVVDASEEREKGNTEDEDWKSDLDCDDEEEACESYESNNGKGNKKRKRVVEDSDDEGPETNHHRHRPSAEAGPSSCKEPASAESLAGLARAEIRLPSRKRALVELMKLQARLVEEGRDAESAVCTNAVFTIQELLNRVERL